MAQLESLTAGSSDDSLMERLQALEQLVSALRRDIPESDRQEHANLRMAGLAHDLNNSLTAVIGHARTIDTGLSDRRAHGSIERCVAAATRGQALARAIIEHIANTLPSTQGFGVRSNVQHAAAEAIRITVTNEHNCSHVDMYGDSSVVATVAHESLVRVLQNLVLNALEATGPGGEVWVRWRSINDEVEIVVEDSGPGIPAARRGGLFRPKVRPGGRGLGLWVCRDLIEEVGGEIAVESREGGGARFRITLPASAPV